MYNCAFSKFVMGTGVLKDTSASERQRWGGGKGGSGVFSGRQGPDVWGMGCGMAGAENGGPPPIKKARISERIERQGQTQHTSSTNAPNSPTLLPVDTILSICETHFGAL